MRFVIAAFWILIPLCNAKVFQRCELAQLFRNSYHLSQYEMTNWMCIAHRESAYNTRAFNHNRNGSKDYGIFQINSYYWCNDGNSTRRIANGCGISCAALLDDNISDDFACARTIFLETQRWARRYGRNGFTAWYAYQRHCQNRDLSDYISGCF